MPTNPASRSRPRPRHRFPASLQAPVSRTLRLVCATLPGLLQTQAEEPEVCAAPPRMVRTGASGRRLRRDFRRLAHAAFAMASPLSWLARVVQTRIHRRADDESRRHETQKQNAHESRTTLRAQRNVARTLSSQTRTL